MKMINNILKGRSLTVFSLEEYLDKLVGKPVILNGDGKYKLYSYTVEDYSFNYGGGTYMVTCRLTDRKNVMRYAAASLFGKGMCFRVKNFISLDVEACRIYKTDIYKALTVDNN